MCFLRAWIQWKYYQSAAEILAGFLAWNLAKKQKQISSVERLVNGPHLTTKRLQERTVFVCFIANCFFLLSSQWREMCNTKLYAFLYGTDSLLQRNQVNLEMKRLDWHHHIKVLAIPNRMNDTYFDFIKYLAVAKVLPPRHMYQPPMSPACSCFDSQSHRDWPLDWMCIVLPTLVFWHMETQQTPSWKPHWVPCCIWAHAWMKWMCYASVPTYYDDTIEWKTQP